VIIQPGVLVPAEICRLVGQLAAAQLKREPIADPGLLRVVEELLSVPVSASGQNVDEWEPVDDAARRLDVTPRTLRRWAEVGKVPARKAGSRWLIQRGSEPRNGSKPPSVTR
jgi:excisionase family DNA binding protein